MRERLIELLDTVACNSRIMISGLELYSDKIADILLAEGVIVLPCKVGQTVYAIGLYFEAGGRSGIKTTHKVYEDKVISVILSECGVEIHTDSYIVYAEDIGKTIFLTKEEAEKALAEREGKE